MAKQNTRAERTFSRITPEEKLWLIRTSDERAITESELVREAIVRLMNGNNITPILCPADANTPGDIGKAHSQLPSVSKADRRRVA